MERGGIAAVVAEAGRADGGGARAGGAVGVVAVSGVGCWRGLASC